MKQSTPRLIMLLMASALINAGCGQQVSYSKDVQPILTTSCKACHDGSGEGSSASGFKVNSYDDIMKGTKYGPVIVPGDSLSSTLMRLIDHRADPKIQMPPHHDQTLAQEKLKPLSAEQISTIKNWIDQGAKDN